MFPPRIPKAITRAKCDRCGYRGPVEKFLVLRGNISSSCNKCLQVLFDSGRVLSTKDQKTEALKKAARHGAIRTGTTRAGRPKGYKPVVKAPRY